MRKIFWSCLLVVVSFLWFPTFSQNGDEFTNGRFHQLLILEEDSYIEYTELLDFREFKNDSTGFVHEILLLDLGKSNKWIYDKKERCTHPNIPDTIEESFTCLETKETVKIIYTFFPNKDKKIEKYTLTALPSGKTFVLLFNNARKDPKGFIPFVKENFSEAFISGLDRIRKAVFSIVNKKWSFALGPNAFRALWGITQETNPFRLWPQPLSPEEARYPLNLHYNCDFDAKFGYPCSKDEIPAKNPKVLVVPQK